MASATIHLKIEKFPEFVNLLDRLTQIEGHEGKPWDEVQGYCMWCGGGWQMVTGPRGGKPRSRHTGVHREHCPYVIARDIVSTHG
jgi:hypothetical protein